MTEVKLEARLQNYRIAFRFNLVEALVYLMSRKGKLPMPSMYEYLTDALFEGLFQTSLKQPFPHPRGHRESFFDWEEKYNQALDDLLHKDQKMTELVKESMDKILRFRHVYCSSPGESYYINEVREWMRMPYWNSMKSTFVISAVHVEEAEVFLTQLFSTTREWCENLAEHSAKTIETDLAYIKEHYHW